MNLNSQSEIAKNIIERLEGHKRVADLLKLSTTQVYRFTYAKEKGGTGGIIPAKHIPMLVGVQDKNGNGIELSDFFPAF